jgi:hypothetical protein
MNIMKIVFARFLIVCWLCIVVGFFACLVNGDFSGAFVTIMVSVPFFAALQFIFLGIVNPLRLLEYAKK